MPSASSVHFSQAVRASARARRTPVTPFLGKPQAVPSTVGTAMMGVAYLTGVGVAPPEPGLHPEHESPYHLDAILLGGAVTGCVLWRGYRRFRL